MKTIRISERSKRTILNIGVVTLMLIFTSACSKKQADQPVPEPPPKEDVTAANVSYNNFAKALFQSKCSSCHANGGSASGKWKFEDYTSVKNNASAIKNAVLVARTMPLGGSLSTQERTLLDAWFARNLAEH